MRLTEVSQMALPPGDLASYRVVVGADGPTRPVSFDQGRHVGAGDRPGSWMAVALRVAGRPDRARLAEAWMAMVRRHDTLRTAFVWTPEGEVGLHAVSVGAGAWVEHPVGGRPVRDALRELLDTECRPFGRPSHRLCLVEHDDSTTIVIASDHAHVDMWSLAVLGRDLLAVLEDPDAVGGVAAGFGEHTRELAELDPAPQAVHDEWRRILGACEDLMPRFPMPLGDVSRPRPSVVVVRDVLDAAETAVATSRAKASGVGLLSVALSALTSVTAELAASPFRAVLPVHSRHDTIWQDAVGWFVTNAVLESSDPDVAACHAAVKAALRLGSWPLAEVLAPWGGMPVTPGMFALSWLDVTRLRVPDVLDAQYVSARIETDGVMLWFIVNATGLHLRCRYPDTPEASASLSRWLDAVIDSIRTSAASATAR